jgi:hypothetical protein
MIQVCWIINGSCEKSSGQFLDFDCDKSLTWRGLNLNLGLFCFIFLLSLFRLENRLCLSHGVQVAGAA